MAEALPLAERALEFFVAHVKVLVSHRNKFESLADFMRDAQRILLYAKILELRAFLDVDAELERCDRYLGSGAEGEARGDDLEIRGD